ncbi:MAG: GlxA family transcriptional regulator [Pseudomonadota bacterium]
MPKNSAKTRNVVFFVYPGIKLLDLAGPMQVFNDTRHGSDNAPAYRTVLVSVEGLEVPTDTSVCLRTDPYGEVGEPIDTLVVVGGKGAQSAAKNESVIEAVKNLAKQSKRVASICTGAFVLASAGLLDRRRAVTHWQYCRQLACEYPTIQVDDDPIFVQDGNIWTSAGVTAGIDLALAIVQADFGREKSMLIARELVVFAVRPGGQNQFSTTLHNQVLDQSNRFDGLHAWLQENLMNDLSVEVMSEYVGMSPRNFARQYHASTGSTPAKTVEAMRVEAARCYLEETEMRISEIAYNCGFRSDERMRKSFLRVLGIPPNDYQKRFRRNAS